jgi:hypothetical protein
MTTNTDNADTLEIEGAVTAGCGEGFGHLSIREDRLAGPNRVEIVITKIFPITIPATSEAVATFLKEQRFTCAEEDEWQIIEYIQAMRLGGHAIEEVVKDHKRRGRERKKTQGVDKG